MATYLFHTYHLPLPYLSWTFDNSKNYTHIYRYGVHLGRTIARGTPSNLTLGNFDCHGDYKNLEERGAHSGNGFTFLNTIGILKVCEECARTCTL